MVLSVLSAARLAVGLLLGWGGGCVDVIGNACHSADPS